MHVCGALIVAELQAKKHAVFSPSGMAANMACIGKLAMEHGLKSTSSSYADEGTCAHFLGAYCLAGGFNAEDYVGGGQSISLWRTADGEEKEGFDSDRPEWYPPYYTVEITEVFAAHVQTYINHVRDYAQGQPIFVEQRLSIAEITGEEDAEGTTDAGILLPDEIVVVDLKFGQGDEVSAEGNKQEMTYALAMLHEFRGSRLPFTDDYQPSQVRLVISQPRISSAPSEWVCSVKDLLAFGATVKSAARSAFEIRDSFKDCKSDEMLVAKYLTPNEKSCKYCKAKRDSICKALDNKVREIVGMDFEDLTKSNIEEHSRAVHDHKELGVKGSALPLIELWMSGVRAALERELQDNKNAPEVIEALGFKLVQGKRGNREWSNEEKAEMWLRRKMGAKFCYKPQKLISPTEAFKAFDKDAKETKALEKLVSQAEGKPSVAPIGDKRDPLVFVAEVFEDLTGEDLA